MSDVATRTSAIHPTAVLQGNIELAEDVVIGAYSVLTGPLKIKAGCTIGSHCIIGGDPEHRMLGAVGPIEIGERTVIRDAVIIHHGTTEQGTCLGCNCYVMSRVYIAHDCQIGDGSTLAAGSSLGGHVHLQAGVNVGMNVAVHQFTTIGAFAMIGMSTPVNKDIPPFAVVAGNPMRFLRANELGIQRAGLEVGTLRVDSGSIAYDRTSSQTTDWLDSFVACSRRNVLFEVRYSDSAPRKPR